MRFTNLETTAPQTHGSCALFDEPILDDDMVKQHRVDDFHVVTNLAVLTNNGLLDAGAVTDGRSVADDAFRSNLCLSNNS
jgi:hypothetical protein